MSVEDLNQRVKFESDGSKPGQPASHIEGWGVNSVKRGDIYTGIINSPDQFGRLQELRPNKVTTELARRWAPENLQSSLRDDLPTISYGTSGTETQAKEGMQLNAVLRQAEIPTLALYAIDTASHPFVDQLTTEADMYAAYAGLNKEDVLRDIKGLYLDRVDKNYLAQNLGDLSDKVPEWKKIQSGWDEMAANLAIPADAIGMPTKEEYLEVYGKFGLHPDVIDGISRAFDLLETKDLPKTAGTLRCAICTEVTNTLNKKVGIDHPFVAVPFDEWINASGYSEMTIHQLALLAQEMYGHDGNAYNLIHPLLGREIGVKAGELPNEDTLAAWYINLLSQVDYNHASKVGHLSGMGYYTAIMMMGQKQTGGQELAFVLDNYEAGKPHDRIKQAGHWRLQGSISFVTLPRGWIRVLNSEGAGFSGDADSNYGAAPTIELAATAIMSSEENLQNYTRTMDIIVNSTGLNTSIAFDVSPLGSEILVVPDNSAHVRNTKKGIQTVELSQTSPLEIIANAQQLATAPEMNLIEFAQKYSDALSALSGVDIDSVIARRASSASQLSQLTDHLEFLTNDFNVAHESEMISLYEARLQAVIKAISDFRVFPELVNSFNSHQIEAPQKKTMLSVRDSSESLLALAANRIVDQGEDVAPIVPAELQDNYDRANEVTVNFTTQEAVKALRKKITSLEKVSPDEIASALVAESPNQKQVNIIQNINAVAPSTEKSSLTPETISTLIADAKSKLPPIDPTAVEITQDMAARAGLVKKTINLISGTQYEANLLEHLNSTNTDLNSAYEAAIIFLTAFQTSKDKPRPTKDGALFAAVSNSVKSERANDLMVHVNKLWQQYRTEAGLDPFSEVYDAYKTEISSLSEQRNKIQAELDETSAQLKELVSETVVKSKSSVFRITNV